MESLSDAVRRLSPPVELPGHDIVVVGASAGGVEALRRLISLLDADLPAAVLVVLHVPTNASSALPVILDRAGPLSVTHARDGDPIRPRHVYVAPPGYHLLVKRGHLVLSVGPTENGHRPSIDALFRSTAEAYGARAIGVVLSGSLDDGAAGLLALSEAGALTLVQDPADALYPAMPEAALARVPVDLTAPVERLAFAVNELVHHPRPHRHGESAVQREDVLEEVMRGGEAVQPPGPPSRFSCPACGGSLWEQRDEGSHYRCRVGHSFTEAALAVSQAEVLEQTLWTAARVLAERADLTRRIRDRARSMHHQHAASLFDARLEEIEHAAEQIRAILRGREGTRGAVLGDPILEHPHAAGDVA
jgi:two-component system, chemotaxis family, protein-glutamate methylesterase/glutaminase